MEAADSILPIASFPAAVVRPVRMTRLQQRRLHIAATHPVCIWRRVPRRDLRTLPQQQQRRLSTRAEWGSIPVAQGAAAATAGVRLLRH